MVGQQRPPRTPQGPKGAGGFADVFVLVFHVQDPHRREKLNNPGSEPSRMELRLSETSRLHFLEVLGGQPMLRPVKLG